jgi:RNA 3'-terminal phosphate cyclase (ATP)
MIQVLPSHVSRRAFRSTCENAVKAARRYLAREADVDEYLADQLLVPMRPARGGAFTTGPTSRIAATNIEAIQKFIDVKISSTLLADRRWQVRSRPTQ